MINLSPALSRLQERSQRTFASHGRWCARHPIPALLTICVLACLLLYPALDLYFWRASAGQHHRGGGGFWTSLDAKERVIGDLVLPWEGLEGWDICDDDKCWERCLHGAPGSTGGRGQTVRLLRVLATSEEVDAARQGRHVEVEHGALERRTLHSALRFQQALSHNLAVEGRCTDPGCVPLSIFMLWNHSEAAFLNDAEIERTIDTAMTNSNLPAIFGSLLAGRHSSGSQHLHRTDLLALTFTMTDAGNSTGPSEQWRYRLSRHLPASTSITSPNWAPRRILLRRKTHTARLPSSPVFSAFSHDTELFALAYFIVGMYVYLTLRKLDQVHSRTGLVFTGLVEITVSGLLSLSVYALFGLEFDFVPWKLLPFVVAVLGVDNMLLLANAVVSTSIDLPVPERVAAGLGSVGFSITVSLLAEISAIICVCLIVSPETRVIRELCIFSIVALIVEYFLELVFFLTVLSIDLQRLELADLLRQGSRKAAAKTRLKPAKPESGVVKTTLDSVYRAVLAGIRARLARVATFCFLFGVFFTMWLIRPPESYLPTFCSDLAPATRHVSPAPADASTGGGSELWNYLNPTGQTILPVIVDAPTFVSFPATFPLPEPSAFQSPSARAIKWLCTAVLIPIYTTTLAVYFILMFFLKDADKLEAQQGRSASITEAKPAAGVQLGLSVSDAIHSADVDLLAGNGDTLLSFSSVDHAVVVLQHEGSDSLRTTMILPLPRTIEGAVSALALSEDGTLCAIGTVHGTVWTCLLTDDEFVESPTAPLTAAVKHLELVSCRWRTPPRSPSPSPNRRSTSRLATILALREDGSASSSLVHEDPCLIIEPSAAVRRLWMAKAKGSGGFDVFRLLKGGILEVWKPTDYNFEIWEISCSVELPLSLGTITAAETTRAELRGFVYDLCVLGTSTGNILVADMATGIQSHVVAALTSPIRRIACVGPVFGASPEGGTIIASTNSVLRVLKFFVSCGSLPNGTAGGAPQLTRSSSGTYRSSPRLRRAGANRALDDSGSSETGMPRFSIPEVTMATTFEKAVEERVASEWAFVSSATAVDPHQISVSPTDVKGIDLMADSADQDTMAPTQPLPFLSTEVISDDVALDGRGGWSLLGSSVVGLRKATTLQPRSGSTYLRNWEAWQMDLSDTETPGRPRAPLVASQLETLKRSSIGDEQREIEPEVFTGGMRRRRSNKTLSDLIHSSQQPSGSAPPSTTEDSKPTSVHHEILPFSRIRPMSLAGGFNGALLLGLGNVVATLAGVDADGRRVSGGTWTPSRSRSGSLVAPPPKRYYARPRSR